MTFIEHDAFNIEILYNGHPLLNELIVCVF